MEVGHTHDLKLSWHHWKVARIVKEKKRPEKRKPSLLSIRPARLGPTAHLTINLLWQRTGARGLGKGTEVKSATRGKLILALGEGKGDNETSTIMAKEPSSQFLMKKWFDANPTRRLTIDLHFGGGPPGRLSRPACSPAKKAKLKHYGVNLIFWVRRFVPRRTQ